MGSPLCRLLALAGLATMIALTPSCQRRQHTPTTLLSPPVITQPQEANPQGKILYLASTGAIEKAIDTYLKYYGESPSPPLHLAQELANAILTAGTTSSDVESQILALYGVGITEDPRWLPFLKRSLESDFPQLQLVALRLLARFADDEATRILTLAMKSNYLAIRIEGAYLLAKRQAPNAYLQTSALMYKLPEAVRPLFPRLFARIASQEAIGTLQQLMSDPDPAVRSQSILWAAYTGRDDLLPQIRLLATQTHPQQQEAVAIAFGLLKDQTAIPKLVELSSTSTPNVQVAALTSLALLGQKTDTQLESLALAGNLFAIQALGSLGHGQETLKTLMQSPDIQIRINATSALLEQGDVACLQGLLEIFISDSRDLGFEIQSSSGKALHAWHVVPALHARADNPSLIATSQSLKEQALVLAARLPQGAFLMIAQEILQKRQNALVPTLIHLLENLQTPEAIALLKEEQQRLGAPLIRNYCTLALVRMGEDGPYTKQLITWMQEESTHALIALRPLTPWDLVSEENLSYHLSPEETSQLLIEAVETLIQRQQAEGINVLFKMIHDGTPRNRSPLAGALIRATEH